MSNNASPTKMNTTLNPTTFAESGTFQFTKENTMKKHLFTISRILLGLILTGAAIAGLTGNVPPPEPQSAQAFLGVLFSSGLLQVVKILELVAGLALLSGFFVPIALVVMAPIVVNIMYFHTVLDPSGMVITVALAILWGANAWAHKTLFLPLLRARG